MRSVVYTEDLSKAKQIPSVAYGVEHGREIPFPPKSRKKKFRAKLPISMADSANGVQVDAQKKKDPDLLLHSSSKPVVDAPKYIPNHIGKRPVKPIVAYVKKSRNFQPKFVVADGSDNIEKFVLDESRPLHAFQPQDDKFIGWFSFLILAATSTSIAFLFIRRSRRLKNPNFHNDGDFISI